MRNISTLLVVVTLIAWAVSVYMGFNAFQTLEATGSGFTRGSNRLSAFLQWQGIALAIAVAASIIGRAAKLEGAPRLASKLPLWLSGGFFALLVIGFVGMLIWSRVAGWQ